MKRYRVWIVVALLFVSSASSTALACWQCKFSPNGWGFCQSGFVLAGHEDCKPKIVDEFNGTTGCELIGEWKCGEHTADCTVDDSCVYQQAASSPLWWTDRSVSALV